MQFPFIRGAKILKLHHTYLVIAFPPYSGSFNGVLFPYICLRSCMRPAGLCGRQLAGLGGGHGQIGIWLFMKQRKAPSEGGEGVF